MIRKSAVAGLFYPAGADELGGLIDSLLPGDAKKQAALGVVAPHAGYIYSGAVAAAVYALVDVPERCIIIGPNHTGRGKPASIMTKGSWQTPLGDVPVDTELAARILAASAHLEEDAAAHLTEHSVEVQLPFLQRLRPDVRIVPIVLAHTRPGILKEIGRELSAAIRATKRRVLIVASSDMTHYEPHNVAREKDAQAIAAITALDEDRLLEKVSNLNITMCGCAPAVSLMVAARELGAGAGELVKYQTSGDVSGDYERVVGYAGIVIREVHPLAALARDTVAAYIGGREFPEPAKLAPEMKKKAGVFVSIHRGEGLRGCIGTFEPQQENVAREVIVKAVSAATHDPRFNAIKPDELDGLSYSVDVLSPPEPVSDITELNPKEYGVIVRSGWKRGLLLPDLEGVDEPEQQVAICRQKAGIGPEEDVELYRFRVQRFK